MIKKKYKKPPKKRNPHNTIKIVRIPPLTSEVALVRGRAEVNKTNRDRSKAHERKVARLLSGRRVPTSGAHAMYKGDVDIPFVNNPGGYIIECKMSAQKRNDIPVLAFEFEWLTKLQREVEIMNAKFGIFVLHYFNTDYFNDLVLMREQDALLIADRYASVWNDELRESTISAPIIDIRASKRNNERLLKRYTFLKRDVDLAFTSLNGLWAVRYVMPAGIYIGMRLLQFRELIEKA